MSKPAKHTCCGQVHYKFNFSACRNGAKVQRGGWWYCGTHDPVAVQKRRDERNAKWEKQYTARQASARAWDAQREEQQRRAECYDDLLAACEAFVRGIEAMNLEDAWQDEMRQARAAIAKARP